MSIIKNTEELNNLLDAVQKLPVKKVEQEKTIEITENGTTVVTPDEGMTLGEVTVNIEVESGGGDVPKNCIYEIIEYTDNGYPKKVKYQIPEGLDSTTIPKYTFGKNGTQAVPILQYIEEVEIPESVINIGEACFSACPNLKRINNYDNLINLDANAFFTNGKKFELKYIPPKVETIGMQAFNGAFLISEIVIPATVKSIGNRAFYNTGLGKVMFKGTPESLGSSAFSGAKANSIFYVPWAEDDPLSANAPWGAGATTTIHYNVTYDADGNPIDCSCDPETEGCPHEES